MTVDDHDNPMLRDSYKKRSRTKKVQLAPLSDDVLREALAREDTRITITPYVLFRDLNHSDVDFAIKPKPAAEIGIKLKF